MSIFESESELTHVVMDIYYKIIPMYFTFYEKRQYNKTHSFVLYSDIQFTLFWKKVSGIKTRVLTTVFLPVGNYQLVQDDTALLNELLELLEHRNIKNMISWYNDCEKKIKI